MVIREHFWYRAIDDTLSSVLENDLHAKRANSLCDATLGVLHSGSPAICAIGQGLAAARSLKPKHDIKQVDRLLSNEAIVVDDVPERWVRSVIVSRDSIVVAMDWSGFDGDNQATIMLALISDHGRSTPLVWLTVDKRTLKSVGLRLCQQIAITETIPPWACAVVTVCPGNARASPVGVP